jgi:hypothetical protein
MSGCRETRENRVYSGHRRESTIESDWKGKYGRGNFLPIGETLMELTTLALIPLTDQG